MTGTGSLTKTIGIENQGGTDGVQIYHGLGNPRPYSNMAILITHPANFVNVE